MNQLGVHITHSRADRPGERTRKVALGQQPLPAYADITINHRSFTPPPYFTVSFYPTERPYQRPQPAGGANAEASRQR